jgi:hypothetical protein
MGDHAGEVTDAIFKRKILDISKISKTFWLVRSPKAKPSLVQKLCSSVPAYPLFIEPSSKGGARPTETSDRAVEYSTNGISWQKLPLNLGPVTGKLGASAYALIFDELEIVYQNRVDLDLWQYADYETPEKPIKLILGCSTVCAEMEDMQTHRDRLKSRYRRIIAVSHLAAPYGVFLR